MQPPFDLNLLNTQQLRDPRALQAEAEAARQLKNAKAKQGTQIARWQDRLTAVIAAKLWPAGRSVGPAS